MAAEPEELGLAGALLLVFMFLPVVVGLAVLAGMFYASFVVSRFIIRTARHKWQVSPMRTRRLVKADYEMYRRLMDDVASQTSQNILN